MSVTFSEDVVPLADLKVNPGRVVRHAVEAPRPVLLTSRARGVAVVQSVADLDAGRKVSLPEAKARFGLAWGRDFRQGPLRGGRDWRLA